MHKTHMSLPEELSVFAIKIVVLETIKIRKWYKGKKRKEILWKQMVGDFNHLTLIYSTDGLHLSRGFSWLAAKSMK